MYLPTATASLDDKLQLFLDVFADDFLLGATADPNERRPLPLSTFPMLFPSPDSSPMSSALKRIITQSHFIVFSFLIIKRCSKSIIIYLGSRQTVSLFCWRKRPWNRGVKMVRVRRGSVVGAQVRFPPGSPPVGSSFMKMTAHVQLPSHIPIQKVWPPRIYVSGSASRIILVRSGRETYRGYKHCHQEGFSLYCTLGLYTFSHLLFWMYLTVLRIHDILVRIRIQIHGSMPLTNGSRSGSWYFRHWPSRHQQETNFNKYFSAYCFLKVHLRYFLKIKRQKRSHKTVGMKFFLLSLLDDRRTRIRIRIFD